MTEIKDAWDLKRLDELGTVARGKSKHRPRNDPCLYGGEYPFIQTSDVKNTDLYISKYSQTYNEKGLAQSKLWKPGTLCITIAANIAETAILKINACFPDSIVGFVADKEKSDVKFVKYYIETIKLQMQNISKGTTQDNLSLDKLFSFKLSVPSIKTQKKIASILSNYDDLIENNTRRIEILEEMGKLIYEEWFVKFRFLGHENVKIIDGVPEGWKITNAFKIMDVLSGGTPKTSVPEFWDGDIPFFTPKDSTNIPYVLETGKKISKQGLSKCNSQLYPKDTLFITARGTVGKLNLAQIPMAMNQSCYALVGKEPLTQYFLYCALHSAIDQFKSRAVGAVFDAIIVDTFKVIPFVVPSRNLINDFTKIVTPYFKQIDNLILKNHNLHKTRDILLPKLISGEIDVSDLDIHIKSGF
jgi:type I restriction enzyme, S subunit